jgi:hypothetical protein
MPARLVPIDAPSWSLRLDLRRAKNWFQVRFGVVVDEVDDEGGLEVEGGGVDGETVELYRTSDLD